MGELPVSFWAYAFVFVAYALVLGGLVFVLLHMQNDRDKGDARLLALVRTLANSKLALESEAAKRIHQYLELAGQEDTTGGGAARHGGEHDGDFEDERLA